jgi:predicted RNA binding protein YcfA (HicA-like mRNA interferase family)
VPFRPLPYREVKRKLEAAGFSITSQSGSHVKFTKQTAGTTLIVIVPKHREIAVGTLRSILRQAAISHNEFELL